MSTSGGYSRKEECCVKYYDWGFNPTVHVNIYLLHGFEVISLD